ncbi:hypothetical protein E3P99_01412 [Wallemia hederae]|uniref:Mannosyltransferase n=1 Tax=Wallemia hederae TaxID=1540922 RepID=A0A4T0FQ26_9BASI|nr:hypothetical protein E3P99_01412 [Wallemia hederae]
MFNLDKDAYLQLIQHSGSLRELYINASTDQLMVLACVYNVIWTYTLSEITGNVSQVDRVWTLLPLLYTAIPAFDLAIKTYLQAPPSTSFLAVVQTTVSSRALLLLSLQLLWSLRLTFNTARRGLMAFTSEDYRWPIVKAKLSWWQFKLLNLFFVAIAQNVLHLITGIPALLIAKTPQYSINRNDYLIFGLGVLNILAEFIADNQQYAYQTWKRATATKEASEKGTLTAKERKLYSDGFNTSGLFAISRHPNFAFEQMNWWLWSLLVLLGSKLTLQETIRNFISPLSMSLLFESSTRLTEGISLSKYPAYRQYQKEVAMFIPQFTLLKKLYNRFPDEYLQSLEVAHRMWYGYGELTWEWQTGIRSVVYPGIYALGYAFGDFLNLPVTLPPKLINAAFATAQDIAMIGFMRREYGDDKAKAYVLLAFTNVYDLYTRQRSLSNTAETALTSIALYNWPFHRSFASNQRFAKSLVCISLAIAVRPTNALVWIPLAVDLLWRRTLNLYHALLIVGCIAWVTFSIHCRPIDTPRTISLLAMTCLDSWAYGSLMITPLNFIQTNIIDSVSHFYGTSGASYYVTQAWPLLLNTGIVYFMQAILDMRTPMEKALRSVLVFVTLVYTLLAHKEWRFIQPLLPIAMALTASRMDVTRVSKKMRALLGIGVLAALYLITTHMRGQVEVSEWVAGAEGVQSVGFYMPCHSTPWQSHIHRPDLKLYAVQCQPMGYNEEKDFYASPLEFIMKREEQQGLEDVVIVFEALFIDHSDLQDALLTLYHIDHAIFNSILHEDSRRRGDVVVLKRTA